MARHRLTVAWTRCPATTSESGRLCRRACSLRLSHVPRKGRERLRTTRPSRNRVRVSGRVCSRRLEWPHEAPAATQTGPSTTRERIPGTTRHGCADPKGRHAAVPSPGRKGRPGGSVHAVVAIADVHTSPLHRPCVGQVPGCLSPGFRALECLVIGAHGVRESSCACTVCMDAQVFGQGWPRNIM